MDDRLGAEAGPEISVEHVNFTYSGREGLSAVIEDMSLSVQAREFVTIVGSSGCGKSTLLNVIAGLLPPTSGRVLLAGQVVDHPGPDRAMVFQDDAVFPWYTVQQNVEYGLRIAKVDKKRRQEMTEQCLEMVGLADCRNLYPRQLSGGMRKRVDVARAIVTRPKVLLMDEPFAALDVMTKEKLQEEFLRIWQASPMTVLFVTHDLEEAIFLADRVAIMSKNPGRLERVVNVPFPRPRPLDIKTSLEFQEIRRSLAHVLRGDDM